MMTPLNIRVFVDVVALMLGNTADGNVFMFDDSLWGGQDSGTAKLVSPVWPGQLVRWSLTPLDVQTMAWLTGVSFDGKAPPAARAPIPWTLHWQGYAPCWLTPGSRHSYRLTLATRSLTGRTISIAGPSLVFMPPPAGRPIPPRPSPVGATAQTAPMGG
ncbi:hypothetical protein [Bradyrhizobium sp. 6(2017)]|uniref:hypothetical protein n=1 Tax=Bradyrhizobium sp. 6(2017) TaxID=1197460 RepID=UPI0013E1E297|nr:hypothetical protein [Bradyrhizobium sp. 6(2017)]QIG95538.1 hypothetical protein G6P99_26150 [Bradyrhizobium sp. 6(2017)]